MPRRKTHEQFLQELYDLVGDEYEVCAGELYSGVDAKIKMKHKVCENAWYVSPYNFRKGVRCPKCSLKKRADKRTKTHEQFLKEIFEIVKDEYSIVDGERYKKGHFNIKFRHNTCFNVFSMKPNNFLSGQRCPKCSKKQGGRKNAKSHEKFMQEFKEIARDEYSIIEGEVYTTTHSHIKIKHNKCDHIYSVAPSKFLSGRKCPKCSKNYKRTIDEFLKLFHELSNEEYSIKDEIVDIKNKITVEHIKCGYIYQVSSKDFISGRRCPNCARNIKRTTEKFKEEVFNLVGNEYEVFGEYINSSTPIKIRHNKCGKSYNVIPNNFIRGKRCSSCSILTIKEKLSKTTEKFKEEIFNLVEGEYELLSEYINSLTHVKIKHILCKHEWSTLPANFLRGHRCPKCNESKGERAIAEWLDLKNIDYERQYTFDDCVHILKLPFDFAVFKGNKLYLVEFDGEQHYKPIKYFGGKESFNLTQQRDQIKNDYCINNNIPLIRIPYWEYENVEEILHQVLEYFNIINKKGNISEAWVQRHLVNHSEWSHEKYLSEAPFNKTGATDVSI